MPDYSALRLLHIGCAILSGGLFAVRGVGALQGARWVMARGVRVGSYAIDTLLLGAGIALAVRSHQYPVAAPWLTTKLVLVIAYVVLGSLALKRARTVRRRAFSLAAALAVLLFIVSVAMTRRPLGLFSLISLR